MTPSPLAILGLGNTMAGDDGVGPVVLRRIEEAGVPPGVELDVVGAPGPELVERLLRPGRVWFVDAAREASSSPGDIVRARVGPDGQAELHRAEHMVSSHGFGMAELLELARVKGGPVAEVELFGVVAERFDPGERLSPPVAEAAERLTAELLARIAAIAPAPPNDAPDRSRP